MPQKTPKAQKRPITSKDKENAWFHGSCFLQKKVEGQENIAKGFCFKRVIMVFLEVKFAIQNGNQFCKSYNFSGWPLWVSVRISM